MKYYLHLTDASVFAGDDSILSATIDLTESQKSIHQASTQEIDINCNIDLNKTLCFSEESNFLCVVVTGPSQTASFNDTNLINNIYCLNIVDITICSPGTNLFINDE